ncbi:peptidoglycan/LPS O-acetylase OafA/YrhL [Kushneria sinocarnis]|uniref:Peptidoglycan/LPS O-acetylase OafA/YrhL n=1 Tax=Kushneria sinocarnis TaxID=595502 RepID=A0A420WTE1_9GAMM|nr:acyltransferase [Kushneria sinocarnis]RKQ96373.1 peptidoglycan/LPS O-acetylase OafA/YrhL [Kushneria sinocarnis]
MMREKFVALDWLRFALAMYLVLFHTLKDAYPPIRELPVLHSLLSIGFFSTSTFFVLSGFLLTHVYLRRPDNDGAARLGTGKGVFWIKRFASLYPIHIFALLIALPLMMSNSASTGDIMVAPNTNVWGPDELDHAERPLGASGMLTNLGLHLTLTHAWNPIYTAFNSPSWSLSALMFFYLVFPFAAPLIGRNRRPTLLLAALLGVYLIPALIVFFGFSNSVIGHGLLHRNPLIRLPEFLAGMTLHRLWVLHRTTLQAWMRSGWLPAALLLIAGSFSLAAWAHLSVRGPWYYLFHNGLLLPSQLVLVLLCALYQPDPESRLAKLGQRLGVASLSIFALHIPLNLIASRAEKLLMSAIEIVTSEASWSMLIPLASDTHRSLWLYPVFLFVVVAGSVLFQEQLVNRTRQWIIRHSVDRQRFRHPVSR